MFFTPLAILVGYLANNDRKVVFPKLPRMFFRTKA